MTLPRDAASVILLRSAELTGCPEVYLVRRHRKSRFMGGKYVFPGGVCEPFDHSDVMLDRCLGVDPATAAHILELPQDKAIAHFVSAARETFEESRVLFAVDRAGDPVPATEVQEASASLGADSLLDMLVRRDWFLDLSGLRYLSHWITPEVEPLRFSARFFVARAPHSQIARHDNVETTDGRWLPPTDALSAHDAGTIELPPPQLRTLSQLVPFETVAEVLSASPHHPVPACSPYLVANDPPTLVLEGDVLHPAMPGVHHRRFTRVDGCWTQEFDG